MKVGHVFLSRALWGAAVVLGFMALGFVVPPLPLLMEGETRDEIAHSQVMAVIAMLSAAAMIGSIVQGTIERKTLAVRLAGCASITYLAAVSASATSSGWDALWILPIVSVWGLAGLVSFFVDTAAGREGPVGQEYHHLYFRVMTGLGMAALIAFIAAAFLGPFLLFESDQPPFVAWAVPVGLLSLSALLCVAMDRALTIAWRDGGIAPSAAIVRQYGGTSSARSRGRNR
jgi:hypothetical protein